jgi:hypothetical protein
MSQPPPFPVHDWPLRTNARGDGSSPQMHQVEEFIARATFSRKGKHPSLLSHVDVVLPPPRSASCIASRCRQRRHRHCPYRARWHIDRPPHLAHHQRRAGDHCFSLFSINTALIQEKKQASGFPRSASIARKGLQAVGSHTQQISCLIPSIDKRRQTSWWPHMRCMVEQVPGRLRRSVTGRSEVAPTRAAISMRRSWWRSSSGDG